MTIITVAEYLLLRLKELGITSLFGVPGDYNLGLLDYLIKTPELKWIGNCNELNSAYAADGYARIHGISALVTTFGVGELSAINGIAGSYAEHIPVISIVGMPALAMQSKKLFLHHNLNNNSYTSFLNMHIPVTAAQVMLTSQQPGKEIDHTLAVCVCEKLPVYIGVPQDIVALQIEAPSAPLDIKFPTSNADSLNEAVTHIVNILKEAKNPLVILDAYPDRFQLVPLIKEFLAKTNLPFVTTPMGKELIAAHHPNFLGLYLGRMSTSQVLQAVENSNCLINFGWIRSDLNTGMFTSNQDLAHSIEIEKNRVRVHNAYYLDVQMGEIIPALITRLQALTFKPTKKITSNTDVFIPHKDSIILERFWLRMQTFFRQEDVICADVGTCLFALLETPFPKNTKVISQIIWGAIGYTLGALLGALMAAPQKRHILFIGDGGFQVTAQELATLLAHKLCPIIFLINNDGYTIERVIHGEKASYNDISLWDYCALPHIFGGNVWSRAVNNELELEQVLQEIPQHRDKLIFIEVRAGRMDAPLLLNKFFGK